MRIDDDKLREKVNTEPEFRAFLLTLLTDEVLETYNSQAKEIKAQRIQDKILELQAEVATLTAEVNANPKVVKPK